MARPKEFDQEKALRKAIRLFSQQGFAATSTDDLMRAMDIGRQSMYDSFGDKRALFLKALELYVTESVHSISVELERPGSALAAVQNALVTFAQRKDLQRRRLHGAQRHQRIRSARCRHNTYHT